jgi:PII-like signaling protein
MGYAPHTDMATTGILRLAENLPMVVDIVDSRDLIDGFMPFLKRAVRMGLVLSSPVGAEQVLPGEGK